MTDDRVIGWRGIYLKLAGIFFAGAAALTVFGFWLHKPAYCGWHGCSLRWAGDAPTRPFGNIDYPIVTPSADLVLWAVLGLMLVIWVVRRTLRRKHSARG